MTFAASAAERPYCDGPERPSESALITILRSLECAGKFHRPSVSTNRRLSDHVDRTCSTLRHFSGCSDQQKARAEPPRAETLLPPAPVGKRTQGAVPAHRRSHC